LVTTRQRRGTVGGDFHQPELDIVRRQRLFGAAVKTLQRGCRLPPLRWNSGDREIGGAVA